MQTATIEEVQAHLPELLEHVRTGEEIVIVSQGKPVGRLVRLPRATRPPCAGNDRAPGPA